MLDVQTLGGTRAASSDGPESWSLTGHGLNDTRNATRPVIRNIRIHQDANDLPSCPRASFSSVKNGSFKGIILLNLTSSMENPVWPSMSENHAIPVEMSPSLQLKCLPEASTTTTPTTKPIIHPNIQRPEWRHHSNPA